jgi:hypothetical protein
MQTKNSLAREAAEDVFFGQIVIIWARWFFIIAAAILALWSAGTTVELTITMVLVMALMGVNFFVHGRYLMEKPANQFMLVASSLFDVLIITAIVGTWQGQSGARSQFFILYYPLVFAFSLVFAPRITAPFTLLVTSLYVLVCAWIDPTRVFTLGGFEMLFMRTLTLAAMGGLGTFYWRVQRDRRRAVLSKATLRNG